MKKNLLILISLLMLCTCIFPCTVKAEKNENLILKEEAIYDLILGGVQTFTIIDYDGNIFYITIAEEMNTNRVGNGTYKVTYEEPGSWKAGYYVVISNNSITSVKDKFYSVSSGSIIYNNLTLESSKKASLYLTYRVGTSNVLNYTGVRSTISGTSLKVSKI